MQKAIRVGRISVSFLTTAFETRDALDLFEMTVASGGSGLIPHLHREYDEVVYGMNGTVTWTVGNKEVSVSHGDKLSIPRGTPHYFINQQPATARMILLHTPGGLAPEYFRQLASCVDSEGTPSIDCVAAVMMRFGVTPLMHATS